VVWVVEDAEERTGETVRVPSSQTLWAKVAASWSKSSGGMTSMRAAMGQVVSVPLGTSEYPMLKYAL
jgi:hypothetical protein